ncbi:hypothetical protein D3C84_1028930 [compost metagenome]
MSCFSYMETKRLSGCLRKFAIGKGKKSSMRLSYAACRQLWSPNSYGYSPNGSTRCARRSVSQTAA